MAEKEIKKLEEFKDTEENKKALAENEVKIDAAREVNNL